MAVTRPGAAAPTCVNIASEMSKWLFECEPQVRPNISHIWATRTEPCMVQKCGSASGMSTDCSWIAWAIWRQSVAIMLVAVAQARGAAEFGHHFAARVAVLGAARVFGIGQDVVLVAAEADGFGQRASRRSGRA